MSILSDELILNDLIYGPVTDPSVQLQRSLQARYPDKSTYTPGEKISIVLSGDNFLDMKNSSLYIKFTTDGGSHNFGKEQGSSLNLFNRARVIAPGGETITDVLRSNLWAAACQRLKLSKVERDALGNSYGFGLNRLVGVSYYTIPLRFISPLFASDQLIPPVMADGMIIELYLETAAQAYIGAGGYTVDDVELTLDTIRCSDSVTRELSTTALTYEFTDVVHSESFMSSADSQIYYEGPHSLTNALEAFAVLRPTNEIQSAGDNGFRMVGPKDDFATITDDDQMGWAVGSIKLPQQKALNGARIYNALVHSQGVLAGNTNFDIPRDYPSNTNSLYTHELGIYAVNLRRSRAYDNSGRELSNGQRLTVFIKQSLAANYQMDVFVYYTARVRIGEGRITMER
jgi:hypothetical protein